MIQTRMGLDESEVLPETVLLVEARRASPPPALSVLHGPAFSGCLYNKTWGITPYTSPVASAEDSNGQHLQWGDSQHLEHGLLEPAHFPRDQVRLLPLCSPQSSGTAPLQSVQTSLLPEARQRNDP